MAAEQGTVEQQTEGGEDHPLGCIAEVGTGVELRQRDRIREWRHARIICLGALFSDLQPDAGKFTPEPGGEVVGIQSGDQITSTAIVGPEAALGHRLPKIAGHAGRTVG